MAKYKPAGSRKPLKAPQSRGAIPCMIVIIVAIGVMIMLFYFTLQSGASK